MRERFNALWARTIGGDAAPAWQALDSGYADRGRRYHNWGHVGAMLRALDDVRGEAEFVEARFGEIELAIFFHDAIYDPLAKDNEARSAELFIHFAGQRADDELVRHVSDMILATATHAPSEDLSTRLLLDLDLRILGSGAVDYADYAAAVRAEYAAVPEGQWRAGRPAVLKRFLARDLIFQTTHFRRALEGPARRNLAAEIATLQG